MGFLVRKKGRGVVIVDRKIKDEGQRKSLLQSWNVPGGSSMRAAGMPKILMRATIRMFTEIGDRAVVKLGCLGEVTVPNRALRHQVGIHNFVQYSAHLVGDSSR